MPAAELEFWRQVYGREFIGADRDYYGSARVEAAVANFAGKSLAGDEPLNPVDLIPFLRDGDAEADAADAEARVEHKLLAFVGLHQAEQAEQQQHQRAKAAAEERMAAALAAHTKGG